MALRAGPQAYRDAELFAETLLEARLAAGLSRADIADLAGVSEGTLRDWKMRYGRPSLRNAVDCTNALQRRVALLDRDGTAVAILTDAVERRPSMMVMGQALHGRRRERGLSQTQAGTLIGVGRSSSSAGRMDTRHPD